MTERRYYVYVYCDTRNNNQPFYVGKGTSNRYKDHLTRMSTSCNQHKTDKIKAIQKATGEDPYIYFYAQNLTEQEALDIEAALIELWGRKGYEKGGILANVEVKGTTLKPVSGHDHHNYGKKSQFKGKTFVEQYGEVEAAKKGKKISDAKTGVIRDPFSDDCRSRMSISKMGELNPRYGVALTNETKALIGAANKGNVQSEEHKENIQLGLEKGRHTRWEQFFTPFKDIYENVTTTHRGIARELNKRNIKTVRGCNWCFGSVKKIILHMKEKGIIT